MKFYIKRESIPKHLMKYFKPRCKLKPKDLVGIPWSVAFALRDDGWYLRSDVIWAKSNPMPESVTDRPTKAHEYIFLLTKSAKYYYDAEAVKENSNWDGKSGNKNYRGYEGREGTTMNTLNRFNGARNKRTVWTVATKPFPEAHFATFPPDLIEPCILAGTSPKACEVCGSPWERVVEKIGGVKNKEYHKTKTSMVMQGGKTTTTLNAVPPKTITTGWQPTCKCDNKGTGRSIVLDPFGGAGTTTLVAMKHERDSIYIDLSEEYLQIALKRLGFNERKMFDVHEWEICS